MYRRNITHILMPLGLGLTLIFGYHLFLKPTSMPLPPPINSKPPQSIEAVASPATPPDPNVNEKEVLQGRSLDLPEIPSNSHETLLEEIRDEIDKNNLSLAETKLLALPPAVFSNAKAKPIVAVLWNNLGLQQERLNGTSASVKAFKKAAALDNSNPVILMNLAHAYWEQQDRALNLKFLTKLMKLVPDEPFPHLAMADLLQEQDRLAEAAQHIAQAADRARQDPALQSYLNSVTAKVRRTEAVEARMAARSSNHFTVKFDGAEDPDTWTTVLDILEDAYRDIGQKFGHFPSKPIAVILHTRNSFRSATGSPAWADGLYDPVLGRIQVPTQGATTDTKWLGNVLRHEYVHALLHDRLGSSSDALPTWLNEGLAMQLAGDEWPDLDQAMHMDVTVIPLNNLEGSWGTLPANASALAYLEANSATNYLIERWGLTRVIDLLSAFKAKASVATALQNKLFVSYEQFHRQWLDSFEQKRT